MWPAVLTAMVSFGAIGACGFKFATTGLAAGERRKLAKIVGAALVVRFALVIVLQQAFLLQYGTHLVPNGDAASYHEIGAALASTPLQAWPDARYPDNEPGYYMFSGALYSIFGPDALAAQLASALFGALTVIYVFRICLELGESATVARWAASLTAFFPVLLFFSAVNMKDSLLGLIVTYMFYKAIRCRNGRLTLSRLVSLGVASAAMFTIRRETAIAATTLLGGYLLVTSLMRHKRVSRPAVAALMLSATIVVLVFAQYAYGYDLNNLSKFVESRQRKLSQTQVADAGSLSGRLYGVDPVTQPHYVPALVGLFLIAPFPFWQFERFHTTVVHLSHSLLLPLLFFFLWGTYLSIRKQKLEHWMLAAFVWALIISSAVLVFGGTPRYKIQVMPLMMIMIAVGLRDYARVRQLYWAQWSVFFVAVGAYFFLKGQPVYTSAIWGMIGVTWFALVAMIYSRQDALAAPETPGFGA